MGLSSKFVLGWCIAAHLSLWAEAQAGYSVSPPALGFTVPSAPPQPPAGVVVAPASDSSLAISWSPPLDDGGADLLAYKVRGRSAGR